LVQKYNVTIELDPLTKLDIAKNKFQHIVFGQQSAPLNVTVFSDFQCSHCKIFHMYLEDVQKEFPNLVQVNYRHYPVINSFSKKLALYGYCMNKQNKYKEFSELVYTQQGKLNEQNLDMMLSPIGYNQSSLNTCLTSSVPSQALASDVGEGRKINVRATPTIIINGFVGSQDDLNLEIKKRTL
jgi:protein-disulfide isomerase